MKEYTRRRTKGRAVLALGLTLVVVREGSATTLRVVEYNIDDSDQGNNDNITGPNNGVGAIMKAIGQQYIGTDAQPIDVLALTEMLDTNNNSISSTTLPALTNVLNSIYGAGTYAYSNTPDPTTGGTQFNGPSGLIYNTHTVQLLGATALLYSGDGGSSGIARAPMRYELAPVGYGSSTDFYMYVSHYKADSGTTNETRRNEEAQEIRANADALGSSAHILYTGDMNLVAGAAEPAYQTITSAGNGRAYDPTASNFVSTFTTNSAAYNYLYTDDTLYDPPDDPYGLDARFDVQLVSNAMLTQPGVQLATDTSDPYDANDFPSAKYGYAEEVFGNNGSVPDASSVDIAANTALNDLNTPANENYAGAILADLMQPYGSDHLPIVGDYNVVGVLPLPATWNRANGGKWNQSNSWATSLIPNVAGETVNFLGAIAAPSTVTLNGAWTAGTVTFNNTNSYTVAPGTGGTLTLDNAGAGSAAITDFGGTHSITAPIALNSSLVVTVNNAVDAMQITGNISGTGGVTTSGSGAVTLSGVNVYTGPTTVNSGLLVVGSSTGLPSATSLTIGTGSSTGAVQLAAGTGQSTVASLAINPGSTLDIMNNSLAINIGSPANDPIATVVGYLTNGYTAATTWTGTSATGGVITSSTAIGSHTVTLGYLDGNVDTGLPAVQANQIVVKYVLVGDSDLSGEVDFTDLAAVLKYFNQSGTDWAQGNFEYAANDPSVASTNFNDLADVLKNFLQTTPGGTSGSIGGTILPLTTTVAIVPTTPVPEPVGMSIVALGAAGLLGRRKRRSEK